MIERPINYKQTDSRWKNKPYALKGESSTIGGSGCGPTSVADLLATFVDKNITPETECNWALKNGYKAFNQGTFYSYIEKRLNGFKEFNCIRLNTVNVHNNITSPVHEVALKYLKEKGNVLICCMGKGPWTKSGHYILVWGYNSSTNCVLINDPASSKTSREIANFNLFKQTVKYYWKVTIKNYLDKEEDDLDVTKVSEENAHVLLTKARALLRRVKEPTTFLKDEIEKAKKINITDGSRPCDLCTREEAAVMALRAFESDKKVSILSEEIDKAKNNNISDGSRPSDYCTRGEAMLMATRALEEALARFKSGD